jgi:transcription termination factor Rho
MAVFDRSELEASPLADLHAIADQLGLEGFRRLRKADLIDMILGGSAAGASAAAETGAADDAPAGADGEEPGAQDAPESPRRRRAPRGRRSRRAGAGGGGGGAGETALEEDRSAAAPDPSERERPDADGEERSAEGIVELLGNGSAFLRVHPPEPSDEDVYISAAQVRRCELVSGDRVSGPLRRPRRSERHPSLVRVQEINGAPAGEVAEGPHYEDRPVAYPSERLALDGGEATLEAVEWLTPFGRGSRALIVGPARAGKTELLKRLLAVLAGRDDLQVTLVLAGVRPEEIADWSDGPVAPAAALTFAVAADAQGQAVEHAIETAKRTAARGEDALVLIDTLDGLHPHAARRALAAARNLRDSGSLTILATASRPFGGETTVIALNPALASVGGGVPLDLAASGTLRAELLVGEDGAAAIATARTNALAPS